MKFVEATSLRIQELLKINRLTVQELAQKSNLPVESINYFFSSKDDFVDTQIIFRICCGLEIEMTQFYKSDLFKPVNLKEKNE